MAATRKHGTALAGGDECHGPERLCALTRTVQPLENLIRFAAAPDGTIVPDLERKLPGRGVSVEASMEAVAAAAKANVFAKSLKRSVRVPDDLAGQVEDLMVKRLVSALSLANKAGLAVTGFTKVEVALGAGEITVLLHGRDAADDGRDKLERKFKRIAAEKGSAAPVLGLLTIEQLSLAIGRPNVVHAGLKRGGATDLLQDWARRLGRYRAPPASSGNSAG